MTMCRLGVWPSGTNTVAPRLPGKPAAASITRCIQDWYADSRPGTTSRLTTMVTGSGDASGGGNILVTSSVNSIAVR
jgi:hypothetical protein